MRVCVFLTSSFQQAGLEITAMFSTEWAVDYILAKLIKYFKAYNLWSPSFFIIFESWQISKTRIDFHSFI